MDQSTPVYHVPPTGRTVRVVGITGMPGSGKSEAMLVAKKMGFHVVRMGDLIWEEVDSRGLPRDAEHVGKVADAMRKEKGDDIWAQRTVERVRQFQDAPDPVASDHRRAPASLVLIDGIRSNHEVEVFRRELGAEFILVAVHTDPDERHDRMTRRARDDDPTATTAHMDRDSRELGWGIARTIAMADEMVVNDTDLKTFHLAVEGLLDRIADADRVQPILD